MYHYLLEKYVKFTLVRILYVCLCYTVGEMIRDSVWEEQKSNVKYDDNDKQRQAK